DKGPVDARRGGQGCLENDREYVATAERRSRERVRRSADELNGVVEQIQVRTDRYQYRRAGPHLQTGAEFLRVAVLFVRVIKDVKGVREKPSLIGDELHPAAILRGLTTSRPTPGQPIVARHRLLFAT